VTEKLLFSAANLKGLETNFSNQILSLETFNNHMSCELLCKLPNASFQELNNSDQRFWTSSYQKLTPVTFNKT